MYSLLPSQRWMLRVFLLLMCCRLVFLIWLYPGCLFTDTACSIGQFFGFADDTAGLCSTDPTLVVTNAHPVMYCLLYGGTIWVGNLIGNQGAAMFTFLLLQCALHTALLTKLLWVLRSRMLPRGTRWVTAAYALLPMYGWWSTLLLKDAFFSLAMLWLTLYLTALALTRCRIIRHRRFAWQFAAVLLVFMLSKNQCFYIVLTLLFFILCFIRPYRWRVCLPLCAALTVYKCFLWALPLLHIGPSGKQEMYGFLFQQTARYVHDHPQDVTPDEHRAISRVLPYDTLAASYNPELQDAVKFQYNVAATPADYRAYLSAWRSMGARHPLTYLRATWDNCDGFFHPTARYPITLTEFRTEWPDAPGFYTLRRAFSVLPGGYARVLQVPVLSWFFDVGFYVPLFLVCIGVMILRRDRYGLLILWPALVSVGVLLISPQNGCYRYVMPVIWLLPLAWGMAVRKKIQP